MTSICTVSTTSEVPVLLSSQFKDYKYIGSRNIYNFTIHFYIHSSATTEETPSLYSQWIASSVNYIIPTASSSKTNEDSPPRFNAKLSTLRRLSCCESKEEFIPFSFEDSRNQQPSEERVSGHEERNRSAFVSKKTTFTLEALLQSDVYLFTISYESSTDRKKDIPLTLHISSFQHIPLAPLLPPSATPLCLTLVCKYDDDNEDDNNESKLLLIGCSNGYLGQYFLPSHSFQLLKLHAKDIECIRSHPVESAERRSLFLLTFTTTDFFLFAYISTDFDESRDINAYGDIHLKEEEELRGQHVEEEVKEEEEEEVWKDCASEDSFLSGNNDESMLLFPSTMQLLPPPLDGRRMSAADKEEEDSNNIPMPSMPFLAAGDFTKVGSRTSSFSFLSHFHRSSGTHINTLKDPF